MTAFVTRCVRCRQQECICAQIGRVETRTEFVILRHVAERSRVSNTGYFAALTLARATLYDYGDRSAPFDEAQLGGGARSWLLYPGGSGELPAELPERVIVLDGSWSQARHMRQRIAALRGMPLLTLPPPDLARHRLRRPTHAYGMSTLEAIARAVALLEGEERAAPLERLHDTIVGANLALRARGAARQRS